MGLSANTDPVDHESGALCVGGRQGHARVLCSGVLPRCMLSGQPATRLGEEEHAMLRLACARKRRVGKRIPWFPKKGPFLTL